MSTLKKWGIVVGFDFFLSFGVFFVAGLGGVFPADIRLLALSALLWCLAGIISQKLNYFAFSRIRYALVAIVAINGVIGLFLLRWYQFWLVDDISIGGFGSVLFALTLGECLYYFALRYLVMRKLPFQSDDDEIARYHAQECKYAARLPEEQIEGDMLYILDTLEKKPPRNYYAWRNRYERELSKDSKLLIAECTEQLEGWNKGDFTLLFNLVPANNIRRVNRLFIHVNSLLENGGRFICCSDTSSSRKIRILRAFPAGLNYLVYAIDFAWHRFSPKLPFLKKIYFAITKGRHRVFPRSEILGRLFCCGFDVIAERYIHNRLYIVAVKSKEPFPDPNPSYGPLVRLKRIGQGGKLIGVYKFRTMHAYAEYLQPYVYEHNKLQKGGKFAEDYRVSVLGRLMRRCWLDELPMVINLLKGNMKLVGVRPLSPHYYGLYSPELQQLRIRTKPGLLPPFYMDMPKTLEEIEASEMRYLKAYLQHPFRTDWKYFWGIWYNILIKRKRSA